MPAKSEDVSEPTGNSPQPAPAAAAQTTTKAITVTNNAIVAEKSSSDKSQEKVNGGMWLDIWLNNDKDIDKTIKSEPFITQVVDTFPISTSIVIDNASLTGYQNNGLIFRWRGALNAEKTGTYVFVNEIGLPKGVKNGYTQVVEKVIINDTLIIDKKYRNIFFSGNGALTPDSGQIKLSAGQHKIEVIPAIDDKKPLYDKLIFSAKIRTPGSLTPRNIDGSVVSCQ